MYDVPNQMTSILNIAKKLNAKILNGLSHCTEKINTFNYIIGIIIEYYFRHGVSFLFQTSLSGLRLIPISSLSQSASFFNDINISFLFSSALWL